MGKLFTDSVFVKLSFFFIWWLWCECNNLMNIVAAAAWKVIPLNRWGGQIIIAKPQTGNLPFIPSQTIIIILEKKIDIRFYVWPGQTMIMDQCTFKRSLSCINMKLIGMQTEAHRRGKHILRSEWDITAPELIITSL